MGVDWRDKTLTRVNASQEEVQKRKKKNRPGQVLFEVELPFLTLLRAAADARGMSSTGYARRAIAAFISKDLDIPFPEITKHFSSPFKAGEMLRRTNEKGVREKIGKTFDDGEGYGSWEVK